MPKPMKFEEAMKKLENIVEKMENSSLDLDDSLKNYEEGVRLLKFCSDKLEEAKGKIEILVKKNGKISAEEFEGK